MDYTTLATPEAVAKVIAGLEPRGITGIYVQTKDEALAKLKELIPAGSSVSTGSSTTLEQIGFVDYLKSGQHPWNNLKAAIAAEPDKAKQSELRKQSVFADYFLGSVHAITQDGRLLVASGSGSQLPAYVYTSDHVIWVAGTHKIVPAIAEGVARIREHCLPLEDRRQKSLGNPGSQVGKVLLIEQEINPARQLTLILVNEVLGF